MCEKTQERITIIKSGLSSVQTKPRIPEVALMNAFLHDHVLYILTARTARALDDPRATARSRESSPRGQQRQEKLRVRERRTRSEHPCLRDSHPCRHPAGPLRGSVRDGPARHRSTCFAEDQHTARSHPFFQILPNPHPSVSDPEEWCSDFNSGSQSHLLPLKFLTYCERGVQPDSPLVADDNAGEHRARDLRCSRWIPEAASTMSVI